MIYSVDCHLNRTEGLKKPASPLTKKELLSEILVHVLDQGHHEFHHLAHLPIFPLQGFHLLYEVSVFFLKPRGLVLVSFFRDLIEAILAMVPSLPKRLPIHSTSKTPMTMKGNLRRCSPLINGKQSENWWEM